MPLIHNLKSGATTEFAPGADPEAELITAYLHAAGRSAEVYEPGVREHIGSQILRGSATLVLGDLTTVVGHKP